VKKTSDRSRPEFWIARPQAFSLRYMIAESTYTDISWYSYSVAVGCIHDDNPF
jgi:hypothetical protein